MKKISLLFLLLTIFIASGCVTREEIEVAIWMNNFHAKELKSICDREPIMHKIGFKRKLDGGGFEVVSVCAKESSEFLSMHKSDYNELLDKALPKQPEAN
jgi:hypothetical protein